MGLLDELLALSRGLSTVGENVKKNVRNPGLLLQSLSQDVQQGAAADKSAFDATKSVMPGVREAGVREMNARGQELGGLLGSISKIKPTKFELAHAEAQRNAAQPVEQGGLGLGPNNTAMERAKALGFDTPAYHGTQTDIKDGIRRSKTGAMGPGSYLGDVPEVASAYAGDEAGANVIPALLRGKYVNNKEWSDLIGKHGWGGAEDAAKAAGKAGVHDSMFESAYSVFDPKNIRSRFAAFDPKKKDSRDLLASMGLLGLLGAGAYGSEQ